ncbi:MAG: ABC transporter permease [Bacteroidetes bacterium GWF2_40_14]|nr:MAG: ABC transporter permease [Bacteroidetes bacterium GWF2_40_14]
MLKYLIEKEFKHIRRNKFLPRLILFFPTMMMIVLPWAANLDVKDIDVAVVNRDHSQLSGKLAEKISASAYFNLSSVSESYNNALKTLDKGDADIILEIPEGFEKSLVKEGNAKVLIAANAVNGTKAGMGSAYLVSIISDYSRELNNQTITRGIEIVPQNRYNPAMDYKKFMVPALMVMLLTILCGFLPALNIVSEKEIGTIEQINVTPVGKFTFILAKLIPYWLIGFVVLTIAVIIGRVIYGITPQGSLFTFYLLASVFVFVVSGFGLVISNYSNTMQQAMFVMFFFMLIFILMSGLFTPVESMPKWAQIITLFNPMKYFIEIMRMVYLKGSGLDALTRQISALLGFAVLFNSWAVLSYRKSR